MNPTLFAQPIIRLPLRSLKVGTPDRIESSSLYGAEVLVRGQTPEGLIQGAPSVLAAYANDLEALDCAVLQAFEESLHLLPSATGLRVGINLSVAGAARVQARFGALVPLLTGRGLVPVLELNESDPAILGTEMVPWLLRLKAAGCEVALDDFGAGFAFLAPLEQLPVDIVKLDRGLVQAARTGVNRTLAAATARALVEEGYRVIAEGIEDVEDEALVSSWGVFGVQGYRYARPMPMEAFCTAFPWESSLEF